MEILEKTILKKKILFTEEDLKLAIINHINNKYPDLISEEDDFISEEDDFISEEDDFISEEDDFIGLRNGIANFFYDPYKHAED